MVSSRIDALKEDFGYFDDWEERYRYLIELGDKLPDFPEHKMVDAYFVPGCVSKVWMDARIDSSGVFTFEGTSNGDITKGMIYILDQAYNGIHGSELQKVDIKGIFEDLGLQNHITPQRRNGFFAMVEKIKSYGTKGSTATEAGL